MEEQNYMIQDNMNTNNEGSVDVMTVKDWILTLLILFIPIANLVFVIKWAIGGESVNKNKRNYFRASLIVGLFVTVIMFLLMLIFGSILYTAISMIQPVDNGIENEYTEMDDDIFGDDNTTEENYDDEFSILDDSEQPVEEYYYNGIETYTVGDIALGYLELPTYFTENTDISYTDFEGVMDVKQWFSGDDTITLFTYLSSVSAVESHKSLVELIKKSTDTEQGEITVKAFGPNTIGPNDEYICQYTEAYYDNSGEDYKASNWVFPGNDGVLRLITISYPATSDENYWNFADTFHE